MKKAFLLAPLLLGYASAASTFPAFPAYDPFTDATGSGGTSYAVGSTLAGQTNAMGQYWYAINSNGQAANALKVTGTSLSYNSLSAFAGKAAMLTNAAGPGARMFFAPSPPLNIGNAYYYSVVLVASNINNLSSSTGGQIMGFGTQGTVGPQTTQPSQGSALWMKQVGTSPNFSYQFGLTANGSPGTPTIDTANTYSTGQVYFVVVAVEAGDVPRLWVNPDPTTFGATTEPNATFSAAAGTLSMSSFTCVQMFDIAGAANNLYVSAFRLGTNWSWVTGGPALALQPVASTNCPTGAVNLTASAMNNGTANGFQWQFNGVNLTDGPSPSSSGATVSGSLTASLSISGMDTSAAQLDSGSYTVVVTNAYGAVTSSVSAVSAHSSPVITTQPGPASLRLYAGLSDTLSVTAVGFGSLSYYWYSNSTLIPAITTSTFPLANVQASANFYCIVSNSIGSVTSSVVSLTVVSPPSSPYPVAVYNDHPISFWPLNEGPDNTLGNNGLTAYDYMGGENGSYTNVNLVQAGYAAGLAAQYGYLPQTDSSPSAGFGQYPSAYAQDSYVGQIPNINFGGSVAFSFSVEAWANGLNIVAYNGESIINKGGGVGHEQFTLDYFNNAWRFFVRNAAGTTVNAISTNSIDGNWHHLVGVVDAGHSNISIYVDGQARDITPFSPSAGLLNSTDPVVIGSRKSSAAASSYDYNFYGNIQDVAVYNYALNATQVANHYYAAGVGPSVAVPAYTNVNEGSTLVVPALAVGSPPLAYQWYDITLGNPGTALTGQTNSTLVISNISAADYSGHSLVLTVTNRYGQASSSPPLYVVLTVGAPSSIAITPQSMAVFAGSPLPAPFVASAQGTQPFSYQWSTNGVPVPGATNALFSNVALPAGTYTIGCQLRNSYGPGPLATASLTVAAVPTDIYGSIILNAGPVAFWRLDEAPNATTAYDYVGSHCATFTNAANGVPGFSPITIPSETATLFGSNGISPSLALENDSSAAGIPLIDFSSQGANAKFSVEAWVKEPPQSGGDVVSKGYPNNTQFAIDTGAAGGSYRFVIHDSAGTIRSVNSAGFVPDGNWHHLVAVCDMAAGSLRFYVDGSQKASSSVPAGSGLLSLPSTYPVVIAAQENQNASSFSSRSNACISQVALYAYALPASQVLSNFNAATFVPPTISAVLSGPNIVITYTGTLVSSTNVTGPINTVVPGATSPYTVPATNAQMFFRSRATP